MRSDDMSKPSKVERSECKMKYELASSKQVIQHLARKNLDRRCTGDSTHERYIC